MKEQSTEEITLQEILHNHCERKDVTHKCKGVLTIEEGRFSANCSLCGDMSEETVNASPLIQHGINVCKIIGLDFNTLCPKKKRLIMLELHDLNQEYYNIY